MSNLSARHVSNLRIRLRQGVFRPRSCCNRAGTMGNNVPCIEVNYHIALEANPTIVWPGRAAEDENRGVQLWQLLGLLMITWSSRILCNVLLQTSPTTAVNPKKGLQHPCRIVRVPDTHAGLMPQKQRAVTHFAFPSDANCFLPSSTFTTTCVACCLYCPYHIL